MVSLRATGATSASSPVSALTHGRAIGATAALTASRVDSDGRWEDFFATALLDRLEDEREQAEEAEEAEQENESVPSGRDIRSSSDSSDDDSLYTLSREWSTRDLRPVGLGF
jgi:hypothetical protein